MLIFAQALVLAVSAQGAASAAPTLQPGSVGTATTSEAGIDGFGHNALVEGRIAAAIAEIMDNTALDQTDPARLINLGIAHARGGDAEQARELFEAAVNSPDRFELETTDGQWVDSRKLARQALNMLDRGAFAKTSIAAR